jgi:hypothetical protein
MAHYADNKYVWQFSVDSTVTVGRDYADNAVLSYFVIPANREAKLLKAFYVVEATDAGISLEVVQGSTVLAEVSIAGSQGDVNEDTTNMPASVSSSTSNQALKLVANGAIDTAIGTFQAVLTY